jgi:transposase-like protein
MAKKTGRPPQYRKNFHPSEFVRLSSDGRSVSEIAAAWGKSRDTMYAWVEQHKEFSVAFLKGKMAREAWWIDFGRKAMNGTLTVKDERGVEQKTNANLGFFAILARNVLGWHDNRNPEKEPEPEKKQVRYVAKWGGTKETGEGGDNETEASGDKNS